jgi:hypothetical protein
MSIYLTGNADVGGQDVASTALRFRLPLRPPVPSGLRVRLPLVCAGHHPPAQKQGWPRGSLLAPAPPQLS